MLGTTLKDRYTVEARIGEGSMGVVYRAHDRRLDRAVAIKVLSGEYDADGVERFQREARAVSRLNHPHVMAVYDMDESEGRPFLVAELLDGRTLADAMPNLTDAAKITVARQIADALTYAHAHNVVHRDLKPSNVMLLDGEEVFVKIMDFGLALCLDAARMTRSGAMVGTAAYMAPEQVVGGDVDGRADLYALGGILYEMFTGAHPHAGGDFAALIHQILNVDPLPPRALRPDLPAALNALILQLLKKKPVARPANAVDVLRRLDAIRFDAASPPPAALPSGTVTFLFTDIEGSTKLWEQHPDAMRDALVRHNAILRNVIEAHDGFVFKTVGDGFYAVFADAADAVAATGDVQSALLKEQWLTPTPLRVRTALHTGDAELHEGDYYGTAVNRCARLLSVAHPGQVLLSLATEEKVRNATPAGATLRDLGLHRLRDLTRPERIFQLVHPNLPDDFPPLRSLEAFTHNLPTQLTSFVGRESEMEEVKRLLSNARLLTLIGTGGCGKTRLSLQVAADLIEAYEDGVWLVELAALTDSALVPQAVASALGVREEPNRSLTATLIDYLKSRHLLLLLDNCEHLIDACAQLADVLLRACPNLQILATSREVLGIAGETIWRVPSLSLPDPNQWSMSQRVNESMSLTHSPIASLTQFEAVRLFVDRATAVQPRFIVTVQNAPAIAQICHRLDGIPLAIELAAARVKMMTAEQIAAHLDDSFRLLTGGSRTALPRQQTLRALIDWSYDLLSREEQILLRRLSVFAGGWRLEAAEQVCADAQETGVGERESGGAGEQSALVLPSSHSPILPSDVLDVLSHLVDKSLVMVDETGKAARYYLLETVRQYSRDRLVESGEAERVRQRHRDYFLALSEEAEPHLISAEQAAWLDRLETEHDNLRAALHWSVETETRLRLASALWRFWYVRGYLSEGRSWLEGALARSDSVVPSVRAKALNGAGTLAWAQGDYDASQRFHEESLALYRKLDHQDGIAAALNGLGMVASSQHDYAAARPLFEETLALYRQLGNKVRVATLLSNLGTMLSDLRDYTAARPLLEEGLTLLRELGHKGAEAMACHNLGVVLCAEGDYEMARLRFQEGLTIQRALWDKRGIAMSLVSLGVVVAYEGEYERATRLLGAAMSTREEINIPLTTTSYPDYERLVATARTELGEESFATAWVQGQGMTLEQAVECALH